MLTFANTHIVVPEFDYVEPRTAETAAATLAESGDAALLMAGGTDLLVQMKMEQRQPTLVVGLGRIASLRRVEENGELELGATATIRRVAMAHAVRDRYTALAEACQSFSTVQIMVMATVGGNLCNASPAADTAPALLAFDARTRLVSGSGAREVPLDEFFVGPGQTVLESGELLESIRVPRSDEATGSAFLKVGRVTADISKVSVAVRLTRKAAGVAACRIALGAVAPTPRRAPRAESALVDGKLTARSIEEAVRLARDAIEPISDVRSTADYRRHVAGVLVGDAIRRAWTRAGGGEIR
jgi:carbon-monoxide dehydrogenase medium subunit